MCNTRLIHSPGVQPSAAVQKFTFVRGVIRHTTDVWLSSPPPPALLNLIYSIVTTYIYVLNTLAISQYLHTVCLITRVFLQEIATFIVEAST